jgi:hypothetical protein
MERYASIRPTWEHISLFEVISINEAAQDKDRPAVTERAMRYIESLDNYKNVLKSAARQKIGKIEGLEIPASLKVKVDSQLFDAIIDKFRETFNIERVKTPFLMRVTLMAYWQYINSDTEFIQEIIEPEDNISLASSVRNEDNSEAINHIKQMIEFGIDFLVFKKEFDFCTDDNKEQLYLTSKKYLEDFDPHLNKKIRDQINLKISHYSDYFNIEKYYPKPRANFGQCNIVVATKVFAGLLITLSEIDGFGLGEIIESLELLMVDHNGKTN